MEHKATSTLTENEISYIIRGAIFKVYSQLGSGMLESVYVAALVYELRKAGLSVGKEVPVPVLYDGIKLELGFRLDLLVNDKVIIEVKSVEKLVDVRHKQVITYLKLTGKNLLYL